MAFSGDGMPDLLTMTDVARVLRCSKAHVCKVVNGQVRDTPPIPAIALGRRRIVRREALILWMTEREQDARMTSSLEVDAGRRA
jgi:hypothetical protein